MIPGQRIEPNRLGYLLLKSGEYGRDGQRRWWARPPDQDAMMLDSIDVAVHPDGTVTCLRLIGGYELNRGMWRRA